MQRNAIHTCGESIVEWSGVEWGDVILSGSLSGFILVGGYALLAHFKTWSQFIGVYNCVPSCSTAHSSPKLGKSPKLLKIFHRRVHSSSAIKFQLVLEEKDTEGSPHVPGSDKNQLRVERKLHHLSPRELAEELTLMDAELLRKIQPKELEDGAWMDKDKVSSF